MISVEQLNAGIVLPIDKPRQWTSFQAVNKVKAAVRHIYNLKKFKIGHAGTLDPLATGLLLVCIGKATKTIPSLQDGDKVYTGTMVLGASTPCFDLERPVNQIFPYEHITPDLLEVARRKFIGTVMQVPPMFSAVKIDGQRAYQYARTDDLSVVIQPKPVNIYDFEITAFRPATGTVPVLPSTPSDVTIPQTHLYDKPLGTIPEGLPQIDFRIHCGKGTYIRSIARDFGAELGSGGFLAALRREQVGDFSIEQALTLDQVENYFLE